MVDGERKGFVVVCFCGVVVFLGFGVGICYGLECRKYCSVRLIVLDRDCKWVIGEWWFVEMEKLSGFFGMDVGLMKGG